MKKGLFVRSSRVVLTVVFTAVAVIATGYTTHAAPSTSDTPCSINYQSTTCQSTDPTVTVNNYFSGDETGCSYVSAVTWGDGQSTTNVLYDDPGDGYDLLGNHTYAAAGTYTISVTLELTAGDCSANGFTALFTLLAPAPAPSPTPTASSPPPPTSTPSLPTQPSPTFVCVTGPGGSCLQPGAGVPTPSTWTPTLPGWLTSPVTGGCVLEFVGIGEILDFLEDLATVVQYDESNGNLLVLLKGALIDSCTELAYYVLTHKPLPQGQNGAIARASTQGLFQAVPKSQLNSLKKLPFLRQRFGYAVAELGSEAALSQKYRTAWSGGTRKSIVCRPQRGGYRCYWSFQYKGTRYTGYVLIGATGNSYRLERVVRLL
jgi:hypothetical protein